MTRYLRLAILCLAIAAVICTWAILASAATLAWDANTEPDLAGYRLYRATGSGFMPSPTCGTFSLVQSFGLVTQGIDAAPNGRWCYQLTAIDNAWPMSNESGVSNRVYLQVPTDTTAPGVPVSVRLVAP